MYFSDVPEGFHLKEWTFSEFRQLLREVGYKQALAYRKIKSVVFPIPYFYHKIAEKILSSFPKSKTRQISNALISSIIITAVK
jgi:predicted DNA-binding transcriptional regulator AlpA